MPDQTLLTAFRTKRLYRQLPSICALASTFLLTNCVTFFLDKVNHAAHPNPGLHRTPGDKVIRAYSAGWNKILVSLEAAGSEPPVVGCLLIPIDQKDTDFPTINAQASVENCVGVQDSDLLPSNTMTFSDFEAPLPHLNLVLDFSGLAKRGPIRFRNEFGNDYPNAFTEARISPDRSWVAFLSRDSRPQYYRFYRDDGGLSRLNWDWVPSTNSSLSDWSRIPDRVQTFGPGILFTGLHPQQWLGLQANERLQFHIHDSDIITGQDRRSPRYEYYCLYPVAVVGDLVLAPFWILYLIFHPRTPMG